MKSETTINLLPMKESRENLGERRMDLLQSVKNNCIGIHQSNKTMESRLNIQSDTASGLAGQANPGVAVLPALTASESGLSDWV